MKLTQCKKQPTYSRGKYVKFILRNYDNEQRSFNSLFILLPFCWGPHLTNSIYIVDLIGNRNQNDRVIRNVCLVAYSTFACLNGRIYNEKMFPELSNPYGDCSSESSSVVGNECIIINDRWVYFANWININYGMNVRCLFVQDFIHACML